VSFIYCSGMPGRLATMNESLLFRNFTEVSMRTRTVTRSLAVGLAALGLAAAGTTSAVAGGHGHGVHKEIHKKKVTVNISDDDVNINDSVAFVFGPLIMN